MRGGKALSDQTEPTLEQWKQLFDIAMSIKKLEPWEFLWDTDLITLRLPGRDEPVCCYTMGQNHECYGIGVCPGHESIITFLRMVNGGPDDLPFVSGFEQKSLMCFYGNREHVPPKDLDVIKSLGLRFRGKNQWIYFQSMEPGYYPWQINADQAALLIEALQNFEAAFVALHNGEVAVDFEAGETLVRSYSPEQGVWLNTAEEMPAIPEKLFTIRITDDIYAARLAKKKQTTARLEMELLYLPTPISENKDERPYLPRFALLLDKKSGLALDQHLFDKDEDATRAMLDMLAGYIERHGRPLSVNVRDDRAGRHIEDFCGKTGIRLVQGAGLPAVDNLLEGMLDSLRSR